MGCDGKQIYFLAVLTCGIVEVKSREVTAAHFLCTVGRSCGFSVMKFDSKESANASAKVRHLECSP